MSVVAFFIWVLFFWCLERDWRFLAGFVLALCLFKPTLVALPVLMLVLGRRWRVLGGFAGGGLAMAALSIATVGLDGCLAWFRALTMNGIALTTRGEAWHEAKYVDLVAFFRLLLGNPATLGAVVSVSVAVIAVSGWDWHGGDRIAPHRLALQQTGRFGQQRCALCWWRTRTCRFTMPFCSSLRWRWWRGWASHGRMAAGAVSGSVGNPIIRRVFAPSAANGGAGRVWIRALQLAETTSVSYFKPRQEKGR